MKTYKDLREYLLNLGFKCVDMDNEGNEIFQKDSFKFAIREIEEDFEIKKERKCPDCKSEDTYLTNLRKEFRYRCNNCGEYFN